MTRSPGAARARVIRLAPAVCLALLLGCVQTDAPDRVDVTADTIATGAPLELVGPGDAAVTVQVHVNGRGPYRFIVDTGATMTCLDRGLADRLQLEEPAGQLGMGMGIGQEPGSLRLLRIDSLTVGEATATGLTGCALDLARFEQIGIEVDGLLGLNFLQEFRVTLDFPAGRLRLERE